MRAKFAYIVTAYLQGSDRQDLVKKFRGLPAYTPSDTPDCQFEYSDIYGVEDEKGNVYDSIEEFD